MLDLFTIFSKGGIVLWYKLFQETSTCQTFGPPVNALIKSVILQERGGSNSFTHGALNLKYKLDNEFELVFVVAFQKILTLSYVDKFLDDIQREFRDKYKDVLKSGKLNGTFDFYAEFNSLLKSAEENSRKAASKVKKMRTFDQSQKSKKTIESMIKKPGKEEKSGKSDKKSKKQPAEPASSPTKVTTSSSPKAVSNGDSGAGDDDSPLDTETILRNRQKLMNRNKPAKKIEKPMKVIQPKKRGKENRQWNNSGSTKDMASYDYSNAKDQEDGDATANGDSDKFMDKELVGSMRGELQNLDEESSAEEEEEEEEEEEQEVEVVKTKQAKSRGGFGVFNMFRGLVGSKTLSREDMELILVKMKDHLISKNVASEIAEKLCDSVATRLEGKVMGTFDRVASIVREGLQESLVQILSPQRRIDILRDCMESKSRGRPYSIAFCGVNGVGKSTNLAKICFWLVENGFRVLIAACDTFRAGAVEQLRTHSRHLNALHPPEEQGGRSMVQLYEKGYGKDAAGIAVEAIKYARDNRFDVVLIDTAGRMQDNEPLMRALAKLIKLNQPDLVLFVGEALVGNEAVDQLQKFNRALADHSESTNPRLIDGIVLTKFDTIDDKVGAAISMTYITGQPIVFVGTGQTYRDLKNLNVKAVVNALLKT